MEPESENKPEPWERPGALRRDCEPHRGVLLVRLADCAVILGVLSICCFATGLLAVPLAWGIRLFALRDLARMEAGLLDHEGEQQTGEALERAWCALQLCTLAVLFWLIVMLGSFAR